MKRVRRSTWIALLIFLGALALYIIVRPNPAAPAHHGLATTAVITTFVTTSTGTLDLSRHSIHVD